MFISNIYVPPWRQRTQSAPSLAGHQPIQFSATKDITSLNGDCMRFKKFACSLFSQATVERMTIHIKTVPVLHGTAPVYVAIDKYFTGFRRCRSEIDKH